MDCQIREVSGIEHAETIHRMNNLNPHIFPPLRAHHLELGFWWIIYYRNEPKAKVFDHSKAKAAETKAALVETSHFQTAGIYRRQRDSVLSDAQLAVLIGFALVFWLAYCFWD